MNCPKCRNFVQPNARFCGSCGQVIEASGASGTTAGMSAAGNAAVAAGASTATSGAAAPGVTAPGVAAAWSAAAAFAAVMSFVHMSVIGVSLPFSGVFRSPIGSGLVYALLAFGFGLLGLFLVALIINALAPTFSGIRNQRQALKVAAYSFTPAWLAALLALSPILPTLLQFVAGCYGIYVLYLGLPILMQAPREKAFGYTATVVICTIVLGILFGVLSATTGYFGHRGLLGASPAEQATEQAAARDQGAAAVGIVLGGILGTDEKGKAGLVAAIANLAKAGGLAAALGKALGGQRR